MKIEEVIGNLRVHDMRLQRGPQEKRSKPFFIKLIRTKEVHLHLEEDVEEKEEEEDIQRVA